MKYLICLGVFLVICQSSFAYDGEEDLFPRHILDYQAPVQQKVYEELPRQAYIKQVEVTRPVTKQVVVQKEVTYQQPIQKVYVQRPVEVVVQKPLVQQQTEYVTVQRPVQTEYITVQKPVVQQQTEYVPVQRPAAVVEVDRQSEVKIRKTRSALLQQQVQQVQQLPVQQVQQLPVQQVQVQQQYVQKQYKLVKPTKHVKRPVLVQKPAKVLREVLPDEQQVISKTY